MYMGCEFLFFIIYYVYIVVMVIFRVVSLVIVVCSREKGVYISIKFSFRERRGFFF